MSFLVVNSGSLGLGGRSCLCSCSRLTPVLPLSACLTFLCPHDVSQSSPSVPEIRVCPAALLPLHSAFQL